MIILALDDEENSLKYLYNAIVSAVPEATVVPYLKQKGAFDYASNNHVDVIFSDIAMPGMDGIEFAKAIKKTNPKINIIFVTGFSEYAGKAFSVFLLPMGLSHVFRKMRKWLPVPCRYRP